MSDEMQKEKEIERPSDAQVFALAALQLAEAVIKWDGEPLKNKRWGYRQRALGLARDIRASFAQAPKPPAPSEEVAP